MVLLGGIACAAGSGAKAPDADVRNHVDKPPMRRAMLALRMHVGPLDLVDRQSRPPRSVLKETEVIKAVAEVLA